MLADVKQSSVITAASVLRQEAKALNKLADSIDESFDRVITLLQSINGKIVLTGIGKSGHIARKISATLASTGTPSFFVHPSEAVHGDLGMISKEDAVIALSNSGDTSELAGLIKYTRRFSIPLIAITGNASSALALRATFVLTTPKVPEACPFNLVPTTSTTMMLALGDALSIALLERRGFSMQDFKVFHPGGKLGQKLETVKDIMRQGDDIPAVGLDTSVTDAIMEITTKGCGCTGIFVGSTLAGIITDGDLRRHLKTGSLGKTARDIMSLNPKTIHPNALTGEAIAKMNANSITSLFVMEDDRTVGIIHLHDCLRAGNENVARRTIDFSPSAANGLG
jgi:arabinose-5-phosphate isomerase